MSRAGARDNAGIECAQAGLTLVELMVSLVIVSMAIAATLDLGYSMLEGFKTNKAMVGVERTARVSMEILSDAVRNASPGVPTGNLRELISCSAVTGLAVTNRSSAPDDLELMYAAGGVLTSLRAVFAATSTSMSVLDGNELAAGDHVIVSDSTQGHLVRITAVTAAGGQWSLATPAPGTACPGVSFPADGYQPGALVLRARFSRFFIDDSAAVGGIPTLMLDPDGDGPRAAEPLAEGIEDLQIAVGVDIDDDGAIADAGSAADEWFYNHVADLAPPPVTTTPPRALRLTLVARSVAETTASPTSLRPAIEDREGASAADEFRRRVLSATVEIRNLEGSP